MTRSALVQGTLVHARRDAFAQRTFRYPLCMASLDLDELPELHRRLRLFSHRRPNLWSFDERDLGERTAPPTRDLAGSLADLRGANGLPPAAHTRLVTNLRVFGYVFNPVSFALGYARDGELTSVIAEVNNTYGGRRRYVLGPRERVASSGAGSYRCVRELFVSPFLHGEATYAWRFDVPLDGARAAITMHVDTAAGDRVFTARFAGACTPLRDRTLALAALRYPLAAAQVIGLIHLEAMKLRWLGAPYRRPGADHRPITSPPSLVSRAPLQ
ncbi:MAG: DUF1365 domain-containing protein [Deltaproteobacteria bacterium]|nr:DUF1365 domain-containing protein [Deltaproteobacteria bacterium]